MKVPDNIYLSTDTFDDGYVAIDYMWHKHPFENKENIEYTRTDAFIEKACDAYCKVCGHYPHTVPTHICRHDCRYYSEFKKAMKGE